MQVSISNIIYEGQHFMKLSSSAGSEFFQSSHVMFSVPWGILRWGSEDSSTHCLRISGEVKPP